MRDNERTTVSFKSRAGKTDRKLTSNPNARGTGQENNAQHKRSENVDSISSVNDVYEINHIQKSHSSLSREHYELTIDLFPT